MRILINLWSGLGPPAGIGHYARQLAKALQQTAGPGDAVSVFPQGWMARCYELWTQPSPGRRGFRPTSRRWPGPFRKLPALAFPRATQLSTALREWWHWYLGKRLRSQLRAAKADWYHEPNFVPLCFDVPTAVTIHDLSPLLYPQWHPDYRVRWLEKHLHSTFAHAQHILTVSEFTRQELIRHCGLAPERISVTYPGIRTVFRPWDRRVVRAALSKWGLPLEFILYVGTLEPRKNLERVLRAYLHLPRSCRQAVPFVLVGKYGWGAESLAELIASTGPSEGVLAIGYAPESWLALLYNGARALVYPSRYEGFGLPPVESLACGGAVVVSDLPVFRETLGPYATRIPAEDTDQWYAMLHRLVVRGETIGCPREAAVAWARRFSWENCARQTWQVFQNPPLAHRLAA